MSRESRSDLDATLDLLCQKIERRIEAKREFDATPTDETAAELDGASQALRLAVSAFNEEACRVVEFDRDAHFAKVIEENTRLVQ